MRLKFENVRTVGSLAERIEGANVRVLAQTLNRAMGPSRTEIRRTTAKAMGAPYNVVSAAMRSKMATPGNLRYEIQGEGAPLPLSVFGAREIRSGTSAAPWGVRRLFPGAFMKAGAPGHRVEAPALGGQVWKRAGAARTPIVRLWGPSVPREMTRDDGLPVGVWRRAVAELPPKIVAELARRVRVGK